LPLNDYIRIKKVNPFAHLFHPLNINKVLV
jgi:hypothetical protein